MRLIPDGILLGLTRVCHIGWQLADEALFVKIKSQTNRYVLQKHSIYKTARRSHEALLAVVYEQYSYSV